MKVAIDSGSIKKGSLFGMGTYVRELSGYLKGVDIVDFSKKSLGSYKVLHFTKFKPFVVSLPLSKPKGTKFVLTIYDLIPLIYALHYPSGLRGWLNWQINKFLIRKNIDAIITISETSKKDTCRFIGINPEKVFVTYLAAPKEYKEISNKQELENIRETYKLPQKFVLCDADIYYSKNIPNLVKACEIVRMPLVLVGGGKKTIGYAKGISFNHPELTHLRGIDWSNVIFLSGMDNEELAAIYNLAAVYVQPSFYEGFGIPLIQAIACKVPVVVTKNQCHVEVLGDEFVFVDPNSPKEIAEGIINPNINKRLPREYSWKKTADETIKVYNSLT